MRIKRKPYIAILLSVLAPGLGHIYNGKLKKGITVYLLVVILFSFAPLFGFYPFIFGILLSLLGYIYSSIDSYRYSKRVKEITLSKYNQWYIYILILIFSFLLQSALGEFWERFKPYRVPTGAMTNTIIPGDRIYVDKFAYGINAPDILKDFYSSNIKRGDIVVFPYPEKPNMDFVFRVIAMEGDKLEIINDLVLVNGLEENTDYIYDDPSFSEIPFQLNLTIPEGMLFVLGDNRKNSHDSRYWGYVDKNTVNGKAVIIYWSHNPKSSAFEGHDFSRIWNKL